MPSRPSFDRVDPISVAKSPWLWATLVIGTIVALGLTQLGSHPEQLRFDELAEAVSKGRVEEVQLRDKSNVIEGRLENGTEFVSLYPEGYGETLTKSLLDNDVEITTDNEADSGFVDFLYNFVPTLLIVGVFLWFVSQMQGGGGRAKFGQSHARKRSDGDDRVTFADVAGADEAVEELQEIKEFLADPERFHAVGARIPKGVMLFGPPGTGKTLLARAVAGEADVPFFTISGSDFVEMFVGVGASRVRDLFKQAKSQAPAIVFVDEIDAVGRHRGAGVGGGHDEREQTLNQLLVEMDGFDPRAGVIVMAATNRADILDPALLRPGRFDRHIVVDAPDLRGREAILAVHAADSPLDDDVDLSVLARRTAGFTGADLANVINEGALLAVRRGGTSVSMAVLTEAIERVMAGPERRSRVLSDDDKRTIAVHEAGHALVGHAMPHVDPIHKVSIVARGSALGWTMSLPADESALNRRSALRDRLAFMLGGRVAEEEVFGDVTTGAADDIAQASRLARSMVTSFGMSDAVGPQKLGEGEHEPFLGRETRDGLERSDALVALVDSEVRALIDTALERARRVVREHRDTLEALSDELMTVETIEEDRLTVLFERVGPAA